jgi:outer membrane protein assembly factor BamE (lipoprotein component of BamABCDE complex)
MRTTLIGVLCLFLLGTLIVGCSSLNSYQQGNELSYVKDNLELGMTKSEVKAKFGRSYKNILLSTGDHEVWRYDLAADADYIVEDESRRSGFDRSGLLTGKLSSQLFVEWDETNVVMDVKLYYVDEGTIFEYRSNK